MITASKAAAILGQKGGSAGRGKSKARDPEVMRKLQRLRWDSRPPLVVEFWSKVNIGAPNECWTWKTGKDPKRHPSMWHKGVQEKVHRIAYRLNVGDIPDGLYVCHHCDNPKCCNPAHLFLGTAKDNAQDALKKGRLHIARGNQHSRAKITDKIFVEIVERYRQGGISHRKLAKEYGLGRTHINRILHHRTWRHITLPMP